MAEVCKDIDTGLAALNIAINKLNSNLNGLDKRLKNLENNSNSGKNNSNTGLEQRVQKLENNQELLKNGIVESLNNFADIENTNREFVAAFQGLYEMVCPLMNTVSTVIEFFGAETE